MDVLKEQWAPALTLKTALLSCQALLAAPEPDDPQDAVVARMYADDRRTFEETAREWTKKYATENQMDPAVGELMEFLDLKHSDFANRVFCMLEYMRGWHVSGSCDFEAYVVSVWNICTLDTDEFRDFVFELYDADESGYLDRKRLWI